MTAQEQVFDNLLLRHLILTKIEKMKYKATLNSVIKNLLSDCIIQNWHRYCSCDLCLSSRQA